MADNGSCERHGQGSVVAGWGRPLLYAVPFFVCIVLATRAWFHGWIGALALGSFAGLVCYGAQFFSLRRRGRG